MAAEMAPQGQPDEPGVGGEVRFSPEAYAQLEALAAAKGTTIAEYLTDALGLLQWWDVTLADGGTIVARPTHSPWEVIRARR